MYQVDLSLNIYNWSNIIKVIAFKIHNMFMSSDVQSASSEQETAISTAVTNNNDLEAALELYGNSVLRAAYIYLHNMADAEDIVQDTFLQLLKTNPVFESAEHEKAWLLRVAVNLSKNKLKSAWQRKTCSLPDDNLTADLDEDLSFVWEAVKALPLKYREVIHLFYHEGYSTAEIGALLKKNESTVRSLLHRGRQLLKNDLKERYDFDD